MDIFTGRQKLTVAGSDPQLREKLNLLDLAELQSRLMSLNQKRYAEIDTQNKVRLIRAIESTLATADAKKITPLPYLSGIYYKYVGLTASNDFLFNNVDLWAESVWANGLILEVANLIKLGYENSPKLNGLVYKSVVAFLRMELSQKDALQRCKYDLHAYIRRQMTWFKKNPDIFWVDISQDSYKKSVYNHIYG